MSEENEIVRPKKRARKRPNAFKHGVYSREVMLPGESIRSYYVLAAEFVDEWAPDGPTERSLVERLVQLHWCKQRLNRYDQTRLQAHFQRIEETNENSRLIQEMKDKGSAFQNAVSRDEVNDILIELEEACARCVKENVPYDESPDAPPWGPAIAKFLATLKPEARLEGAAKFVTLVDTTRIHVDMDRSNRIDEAIDRTIKRLMQVKTAKQIFPKMRNAKAEPKLINAQVLPRLRAESGEKEQNVELPDMVEVFAKRNSVDPQHP